MSRGGPGPNPADTVAAARAGGAEHEDGRGPAREYLLVFNTPEAPGAGIGVGWTLVAEAGGARVWSVALAGRGAGAHADPRTARAVAVRVLAGHGVTVEDWALEPDQSNEPDRPPRVRARLPAAVRDTAPIPPLRRRGRRRGVAVT